MIFLTLVPPPKQDIQLRANQINKDYRPRPQSYNRQSDQILIQLPMSPSTPSPSPNNKNQTNFPFSEENTLSWYNPRRYFGLREMFATESQIVKSSTMKFRPNV